MSSPKSPRFPRGMKGCINCKSFMGVSDTHPKCRKCRQRDGVVCDPLHPCECCQLWSPYRWSEWTKAEERRRRNLTRKAAKLLQLASPPAQVLPQVRESSPRPLAGSQGSGSVSRSRTVNTVSPTPHSGVAGGTVKTVHDRGGALPHSRGGTVKPVRTANTVGTAKAVSTVKAVRTAKTVRSATTVRQSATTSPTVVADVSFADVASGRVSPPRTSSGVCPGEVGSGSAPSEPSPSPTPKPRRIPRVRARPSPTEGSSTLCTPPTKAARKQYPPVLSLPPKVTRYSVPIPGAGSPGGVVSSTSAPNMVTNVGFTRVAGSTFGTTCTQGRPFTPIPSHQPSPPEEGELPATFAVSGGVELVGLGQQHSTEDELLILSDWGSLRDMGSEPNPPAVSDCTDGGERASAPSPPARGKHSKRRHRHRRSTSSSSSGDGTVSRPAKHRRQDSMADFQSSMKAQMSAFMAQVLSVLPQATVAAPTPPSPRPREREAPFRLLRHHQLLLLRRPNGLTRRRGRWCPHHLPLSPQLLR